MLKKNLWPSVIMSTSKNVRATASRFEIEPKQVREWVKKKQDLLNVAPYILTLNRGRQAHFPLLEEKLVEWNKY